MTTTAQTTSNGPAPAAAPKMTKLTQPECDTLATVPARYKWAISVDVVAAALGPSSRRTADNVRRVLASGADRVTFASSAPLIGKTVWGCAALVEYSRRTGVACLFVDASTLAADAALVASAIACPGAVLIDGLGEEADPAHSPVSRVVSARYGEQRTTIATTPLTREKVEERYGVGLGRRLYDAKSGAEVIDCALRS